MKKFHLRILGDLGFEYWADVPGYEGLYQVSTYGNVRSIGNSRGRKPGIMKPAIQPKGYERVNLYKDCKMKTFKVHRLVGMAFLPRFNEGDTEINHKNEIKTDNRVHNLEFCSRQYNINFGTRNKRIGKTLKEKNISCKPILQFNKEGNLIKEWPSATEVHQQLGFENSNISNCCNKKQKTAYGYIWKFKECVIQ